MHPLRNLTFPALGMSSHNNIRLKSVFGNGIDIVGQLKEARFKMFVGVWSTLLTRSFLYVYECGYKRFVNIKKQENKN
jgi:hypothetical protein